MAGRSKVPAIGSAGWILEERHQSNDLVSQELEDFGFSVRNELEWLNEHMSDICANDAQHNLEVFKTPGKLRGKTPRTARKKAIEPRQPLANLIAANAQNRPSPAEQSLRNNLQKPTTKARFHIVEDESKIRVLSPAAKTPIARQLFSQNLANGKENHNSSLHIDAITQSPAQPSVAPWSQVHSTQDTVMSSQDDDDVFSQPYTQATQPTQPSQQTYETNDERRDTGDSFVSAKEAFASKNPSRENLRTKDDDAMDADENADTSRSDGQDTVIRHELSSDGDEDEDMQDIPDFPDPPRILSEQYSISAETHAALDTAHHRAHAPEPKTLFAPGVSTTPAGYPPALSEATFHDDTIVHHEVDDQMDIDDDVRSPSDNSSPVKPLVRKSSLTFASLPAREPLLAKKSMGNRVSRTSHVDPSKARNSQMGRYTGGKSLGGSQLGYPTDAHDDEMDEEDARPVIHREESETTKIHNKTSTQRLYERINMLKQQNEAPKRTSQSIISSQSSQPQSFTSAQSKEDLHPGYASQPAYPSLPAAAPVQDDDDDDDWISPVRTAAPAPKITRPVLTKSQTVDSRPSPAKPIPSKLISVSNPDLSTVVESTTPVGSPTGKKYMDGPLSASKAKFYSALRAAKEKIIGSSATSAQVKLDALAESPMRPKLQAHGSSDDIFGSPKRTQKPGIFSHLRSPSKESNTSTKSTRAAAVPGSPMKNDGRRTRSSTERQKQKGMQERDAKDVKQKQRAEDKFREMREKEQSRAAAHHQKSGSGTVKTPSAMSSQSSLRQPAPVTAVTKTPTSTYAQQPLSRHGISRVNTTSSRDQDVDSADEMPPPPPPPPKSLLPTTKTTKAALREPRKLMKHTSKEALPKAKAPQKIMVNMNSSRYGQAPPPAARPTPTAATKPPPVAPVPVTKSNAPPSKPASAASSRPASALSGKSKAAPVTKAAAPRVVRPQQQVVEKLKAAAPQPPRADLGASRPVSRMQTVQDANRINIPPVNPAKPAKRPFQGENDETLHRPAKRPSQQAKMNPITPAHAQFAKGKIPFAESAHAPQSHVPTIQYPNGDDIKLPEIMTDSEDEDSENEFEQPSWVNTPNLREMLASQQLMDPETIFGPIAPLNMEQVFPNKERHKRFRERTSSAYWANDQVTEEEKRKEREARERLVRDGAWSYNPSPRPAAGSSR
ncbi:inner centromere protein-like protein [Phaeosphaeriaceae sp. PMI808]|nr:inner centromere protein-like protein [Phaeosphaeriaceae sp. PMI808]